MTYEFILWIHHVLQLRPVHTKNDNYNKNYVSVHKSW